MSEFAVTITAKEQAELLEVEVSLNDLGPNEVAGKTLSTLISAGTELNSAYLADDNFPKRPGYASVFDWS